MSPARKKVIALSKYTRGLCGLEFTASRNIVLRAFTGLEYYPERTSIVVPNVGVFLLLRAKNTHTRGRIPDNVDRCFYITCNGRPMKTFRDATRKKDFVISAEIFLRPESSAEMIAVQARLLKSCVDGVLLTDNQSGSLHMSPVAAASLMLANGIDPIVQLACRNRNRIALLAELLGGAALGVSSFLMIRGNRVPDGFTPRPKAVFDVDATELIAMASKMKNDELVPALPDLFIGSVVTPHSPRPGWVPKKLTQNADAGGQFVQTHICMDPELLAKYMKHLVASGLLRRLSVLVSLAVFGSADDALWLREHRPSYRIPDEVIRRLEQAADAEQEGIRICAEQIQQLAEIPGISGVHLVASRQLESIPATLALAGLNGGA